MGTVKVESERIVNIAEMEKLISDARVDAAWLKKALEKGDIESSQYLLGRLDLKLHSMQAFEYVIERRTINV